jgi:hypothetical protein
MMSFGFAFPVDIMMSFGFALPVPYPRELRTQSRSPFYILIKADRKRSGRIISRCENNRMAYKQNHHGSFQLAAAL